MSNLSGVFCSFWCILQKKVLNKNNERTKIHCKIRKIVFRIFFYEGWRDYLKKYYKTIYWNGFMCVDVLPFSVTVLEEGTQIY